MLQRKLKNKIIDTLLSVLVVERPWTISSNLSKRSFIQFKTVSSIVKTIWENIRNNDLIVCLWMSHIGWLAGKTRSMIHRNFAIHISAGLRASSDAEVGWQKNIKMINYILFFIFGIKHSETAFSASRHICFMKL